MEWLQTVLGASGAALMSVISAFGEDLLMIAILGFVFWSLDKKAGKYVGMSLVMNVAWNPLIKNAVLRRRPYFDNPGIKCLKPVESGADIYDIAKQGFSFPSGHASNSASAYGALARFIRKKWLTALCVALTALVGISRFCVGVHYPTDVICGWLLGTVIVFLIPWLDKVIEKRIIFYGILLLSAIPGIFYCKTTDYFTGLGMLLGFLPALSFEEKYVKFENTRKPISMILRVVGGIAIYFALSFLLKFPFSEAFLESDSATCFAVRVVRYAIIIFIEIGVYPLLFKTKVLR